MQAVSKHVTYIGVDDDNLDLFEGQYPLNRGISYNSYLIDGRETIAIVDTVDARRQSEWLNRLSGALRGRCPNYLIVQHVEPDHSGCVKVLLEQFPELTLVATSKAIEMLGNFFESAEISGRAIAVKDNETFRVGDVELRFFTAPMVHWPEVMMTLNETDGVLFSADAFGSFASYNDSDAWDSEARRYYCNIVGKYGASVQSVMKKLTDKSFGIVAPLHGPLLTEDLAHYWNLYDRWSRYEPETDGVLVAYASVYGGTAEAARRLAAELADAGAGEVVLMDLSRHDVSLAVAEAFRLSRMALCSITYDGGLFPPMATFLHHVASKGLRNRAVAIIENGSWAPLAGKLIVRELEKMSAMTVVEPVVTLKSRLHSADTESITELARNLSPI